MSTSEQLERETEEERARISETLDELRGLMTPGHVVDRLVDYASDASGGMFFRNLRQQAVDNPIPVALVGAGLGWLALAGRRRGSTIRTRADDLFASLRRCLFQRLFKRRMRLSGLGHDAFDPTAARTV